MAEVSQATLGARGVRGKALAGVLAAWLGASGCGGSEPEPAGLQELRLPTGAVLSPDHRWLFVADSNLDLERASSSLVTVDLQRFLRATAETPRMEGEALTPEAPCRRARDEPAVRECEPRFFLSREHGVRLPTGLGNLVLDLPGGPEGPWNLLAPLTHTPGVAWVRVTHDASGIDLECEQNEDELCGERHVLRTVRLADAEVELADDPARLSLDAGGFRFAYLPHLLGGAVTLVDLDAPSGPALTDIRSVLIDPDSRKGVGGFAVAARPCDPAAAPAITQMCQRPLLYVTQRFWPGLRTLTVDSGLGRWVAFESGLDAHPLEDPDLDWLGSAADRPRMGALAFEDAAGERLLVVRTTPPALLRLDTRLGDDGWPLDQVVGTLSLCKNPNLLALHRPADGRALAFVSCYSDDAVAVVDLSTFALLATVTVDDGPNELVVDAARAKLYVVHTLASTIGVIELDRESPEFLAMTARLGLID
ncbi:hypothetical protein [Nannocystis sp. SCPEA4]|uniref:YncE family protein n=1 Tax=Nannocystis sp. SCPEA4 TaxID=2996787 RepID=UPI00226F37BA|nr:hypothetical protein [Nannocystis sp. SCPEA4]MCY1057546.1 hypothetical protein [Nannocystis sp. SCPEA4]